jgi:predicted enzyme related to lactoylglutathione lyase
MEDMLDRAVANGGEVITPVTSLGEHGWYAFMKDTEGNKIGLHRNA